MQMISEARRRGMQAHLGLTPLLPPDPRPGDLPVRVDGVALGPPRVADLVCLNSPAARQYALAFVQDTVLHYAEIDGLILDWVEFGAYKLEDHFTCFCPHCQARAVEAGFDWEAIRRDVRALWDGLHVLSPGRLAHSRRLVANASAFLELLVHFPAWLAFLRFKADSVLGFYREIREGLDQAGWQHVSLTARGWCPPWNLSSGITYRSLAEVCQAVAPKLFTFDHAVIPRWVGEVLLDWNPALSEQDVLDAVVAWLNLEDGVEQRSFSSYQIPAPGVSHPARLEGYRQRIDEVIDQVDGRAACYPIAHPYVPVQQWRQMVALIRDSRADGMWVNFYSYLSDAHMEVLRQTWPP
jgi:hypothetical protein